MKAYLDENQDISKEVDFSIKEKDRGERARLAKVFGLRGLDPETETLLQTNVARWEAHPEEFWHPPSQSGAPLPRMEYEANIVGSYILARRDTA